MFQLPMDVPLSQGVFLAGFECSDHRLEEGRRLDLLGSTGHIAFASADYARLRSVGIQTCREGISWVRCEPSPGVFDFSSLRSRLTAAQQHGVGIVWDVMHFGWPDHVDPFALDFPQRFALLSRALAVFLSREQAWTPVFTLINEMSFLSWAGGDMGCMNPFARARSAELKVQLVLATLAGMKAVRVVLPRARFLQSEPMINVVPSAQHPKTWREVERSNLAQFEALDMLQGRAWKRLGGSAECLDIVGINVYPDNQFMLDGTTVGLGDRRYKRLSTALLEVWARYRRPMIISETGCEGAGRAAWLRYVADEAVVVLEAGCPLWGITLYPVLNHPGWVDDRHCHNGLWDYPTAQGEREIDSAYALELARQTPRLLAARAVSGGAGLQLSA